MPKKRAKNGSELLACRVCLGTDSPLFNINEHGLTQSFQTVIGYEIPLPDELPQHVCCYCVPLLRKYVRFKNIYLEAQDILTEMLLTDQLITTETLRDVHQRNTRLSSLRLSLHHTPSIQAYSEEQPLCKENSAIKVEEPCKSEGPEFEPLDDIVKAEVEEEPDAGWSDGDASDDEHLSGVQGSEDDATRQEPRGRDAARFPADLDVDVVELTKEEQIAEVQARRTSANYLSSPLKCEFCFKGFLNETTYQNHMHQHDPYDCLFTRLRLDVEFRVTLYTAPSLWQRAGAHECDVCRARFPSRRKLTEHARGTHARRYVCRLCRNTAQCRYQARLHQNWHQGVTYDCGVCGKSFSKLTTQLTHTRLVHRGAHACAHCGAGFLSDAGRRAHEVRAHRTPEGSCEEGPRCEPCALRFDSAAALAAHLRTSSKHSQEVAGNMDNHCTMCGESFPSNAALRKHLAAHRNSGTRVCDECGVSFKCVRAYTAHYKRAHLQRAGIGSARPAGAGARAKDYVCELCGFKCSRCSSLPRAPCPVPRAPGSRAPGWATTSACIAAPSRTRAPCARAASACRNSSRSTCARTRASVRSCARCAPRRSRTRPPSTDTSGCTRAPSRTRARTAARPSRSPTAPRCTSRPCTCASRRRRAAAATRPQARTLATAPSRLVTAPSRLVTAPSRTTIIDWGKTFEA